MFLRTVATLSVFLGLIGAAHSSSSATSANLFSNSEKLELNPGSICPNATEIVIPYNNIDMSGDYQIYMQTYGPGGKGYGKKYGPYNISTVDSDTQNQQNRLYLNNKAAADFIRGAVTPGNIIIQAIMVDPEKFDSVSLKCSDGSDCATYSCATYIPASEGCPTNPGADIPLTTKDAAIVAAADFNLCYGYPSTGDSMPNFLSLDKAAITQQMTVDDDAGSIYISKGLISFLGWKESDYMKKKAKIIVGSTDSYETTTDNNDNKDYTIAGYYDDSKTKNYNYMSFSAESAFAEAFSKKYPNTDNQYFVWQFAD